MLPTTPDFDIWHLMQSIRSAHLHGKGVWVKWDDGQACDCHASGSKRFIEGIDADRDHLHSCIRTLTRNQLTANAAVVE